MKGSSISISVHNNRIMIKTGKEFHNSNDISQHWLNSFIEHQQYSEDSFKEPARRANLTMHGGTIVRLNSDRGSPRDQ